MIDRQNKGIIRFNDPVPNGGGCNVCTGFPPLDPVTELEAGSLQSTHLTRLCAEHLKELRTLVLAEYLKRISIPSASQRRKDGGLA